MGTYINLGNENFQSTLNSEFVDKSGLISIVNKTLFTRQRFSCVTRCRRFGKTLAAEMLCAYYDRSCDSRHLFADLEIASDPSFEQHLNKYPVIFLDITNFTSQKIPRKEIVDTIQKEVQKEVLSLYPDVKAEEDDDLMAVLIKVADHYHEKFIMIIDEWDAICREASDGGGAMDSYINLHRRLFKGSNTAQVFAAVYMTGILPIKKNNIQSGLNNFIEYSMLEPGRMAKYFGFTKDEVKLLAEKHGTDYDELEKWYDGYQIGDELSMFNPTSVMQAILAGECSNYWVATGSYYIVSHYIQMNFEGLKENVISMLDGGRCRVNPTRFLNDMSIIRCKDDVLTMLIHLGYLTYDWNKDKCFIPNREVRDDIVNAVELCGW